MITEPGSKWRCNQCHYGVYEIVSVEENTVLYRVHPDEDNRLLSMHLGLWLITHEPIIKDHAPNP
jgi:hypothetical protein